MICDLFWNYMCCSKISSRPQLKLLVVVLSSFRVGVLGGFCAWVSVFGFRHFALLWGRGACGLYNCKCKNAFPFPGLGPTHRGACRVSRVVSWCSLLCLWVPAVHFSFFAFCSRIFHRHLNPVGTNKRKNGCRASSISPSNRMIRSMLSPLLAI